MPAIPQQVTVRYLNRLLREGTNDQFKICELNRDYSKVDNVVIGVYYRIVLKNPLLEPPLQIGIGVTPAQALQRALEKHGVTFR